MRDNLSRLLIIIITSYGGVWLSHALDGIYEFQVGPLDTYIYDFMLCMLQSYATHKSLW